MTVFEEDAAWAPDCSDQVIYERYGIEEMPLPTYRKNGIVETSKDLVSLNGSWPYGCRMFRYVVLGDQIK